MRELPRPALVLLAGAALLVGAVVVTGDDTTGMPAAEPGAERVGQPWCPQASAAEGSAGRFALDGRVATVRQGAAGTVLGMDVLDWFRGPPVSQVEVEVAGASSDGVRAGDRLLVQGSWRPDGAPPVVDGCRARPWTASLARAWGGAPGAGGASPGPAAQAQEPVARYGSVGFRRTGPAGGPVITGVLVRERDCLYLADGLTRWVPVFPSGQTSWDPVAERVLLAGYALGVGEEVRLGGSPELGGVSVGGEAAEPGEREGRLVDPAGLPAGCDPDAPRFVVGESVADPLTTEVLSTGDPHVRAVREAARAAALAPSAVAGRLELDEFGGQSLHFEVTATAGPLAGDVAVSVGTLPGEAWPDALDTDDSTVLSTADGPVRGLPARPAADSELVLLERPGRTHVMVRTPGRMVVTVTVALPATDDRVAAMAGLADAVASGGAAGQR